VNGDATHLGADHLNLPSVDPDANFQADCPETLAECSGTSDRVGRLRERREEPVAGSVDLAPPKVAQRLAHEGVVSADDLAPPAVAVFRGELRRPDACL